LRIQLLNSPWNPKGYDVRRERACNFFKGLSVKHQEERAITLAVEDDGDDHAQTIRTTRSRNEHRFSRVTPVLEPASHLIASQVEAQELIIKPVWPILSTACGIGREGRGSVRRVRGAMHQINCFERDGAILFDVTTVKMVPRSGSHS
jgi:hypothetical protein